MEAKEIEMADTKEAGMLHNAQALQRFKSKNQLTIIHHHMIMKILHQGKSLTTILTRMSKLTKKKTFRVSERDVKFQSIMVMDSLRPEVDDKSFRQTRSLDKGAKTCK
jgi:hypothetical protein